MKLSSSINLETTIDGFLDNSFFVVQPQKGNHRSGLDAVLLAATIAEKATGRLADLGSGCGVAGMAVAQRCSNIQADLFEINPRCVEYTRQSIELPQNTHLKERLNVVQADVTLTGDERQTVGLEPNTYDHIISNPPYNDASHQVTPMEEKAQAHVLHADMLLKWVKTAAYIARHKAKLTLIMRPENLPELLTALEGRFGSIKIKPVQAVAIGPAFLMLVRAVKGGKAPLQMLAPIAIRDNPPKDSPHELAQNMEEISRGRACLEL